MFKRKQIMKHVGTQCSFGWEEGPPSPLPPRKPTILINLIKFSQALSKNCHLWLLSRIYNFIASKSKSSVYKVEVKKKSKTKGCVPSITKCGHGNFPDKSRFALQVFHL